MEPASTHNICSCTTKQCSDSSSDIIYSTCCSYSDVVYVAGSRRCRRPGCWVTRPWRAPRPSSASTPAPTSRPATWPRPPRPRKRYTLGNLADTDMKKYFLRNKKYLQSHVLPAAALPRRLLVRGGHRAQTGRAPAGSSGQPGRSFLS